MYYVYDGLEVVQESPAAGLGVRAMKDISARTLIPCIGVPMDPEEYFSRPPEQMSHVYPPFNVLGQTLHVDGTLYDLGGLNIASKVNEPIKSKPNCIFKSGFLITARRIKRGEFLSVYYGDGYRRHHVPGYEELMQRNRYLHNYHPQLEGLVITPSQKEAIVPLLMQADAMFYSE